jgi:hypothetical protein
VILRLGRVALRTPFTLTSSGAVHLYSEELCQTPLLTACEPVAPPAKAESLRRLSPPNTSFTARPCAKIVHYCAQSYACRSYLD